MELLVNGAKTYCYTGGKAFDPAKPTVLFIHGVVHDHSVWILQTRYMATHGWNVWRWIFRATAAAAARHRPRWRKRPNSSLRCWTRPV